MNKLLLLLLSLLLLFSLAVPAFAVSSVAPEPDRDEEDIIPSIEGAWLFAENPQNVAGLPVLEETIYFSSNSIDFAGMKISDSDPSLLIQYEKLDGSLVVAFSNGAWIDAAYRLVDISGNEFTSLDFDTWFPANATKQGASPSPSPVDPPATYTTTINFYDNAGANLLYSISESAENNCPQVTLTCNGNSVDFSGDGISQQPFRSAYPLAGFASTAGSSEVFLSAGKKMAVGGQARDITVNLYAIPANFTTTVNVYDFAGSELLYTYSDSASSYSPQVTLQTDGSGVQITGAKPGSYFTGMTAIAGFSNTPGSYDLYLAPEKSVSIGGDSSDVTVNLYVVPVRSFTTTIKIFDNSGQTLLHTYSAEADGACPPVTVTATENGCTFTGPHDSTFVFSGAEFSGLTNVAGSTDLVLSTDSDPFVSPSGASNFLYHLFVVTPPDESLGFLDRIWKGISTVPQKIINLLKPAWLRNLWGSFDFSFVVDFFAEAYDAATHGFYLKDYFEGESSIFGVLENHPFAWLRGD